MPDVDRKQLEARLNQLEVAKNDGKLQVVKEFTDTLLELTDGLSTKLKKVRQAKILLSSLEKRLGSKLPDETKEKIEATIKKIEEGSHTNVTEELRNLREMVTVIEADYGEA